MMTVDRKLFDVLDHDRTAKSRSVAVHWALIIRGRARYQTIEQRPIDAMILGCLTFFGQGFCSDRMQVRIFHCVDHTWSLYLIADFKINISRNCPVTPHKLVKEFPSLRETSSENCELCQEEVRAVFDCGVSCTNRTLRLVLQQFGQCLIVV